MGARLTKLERASQRRLLQRLRDARDPTEITAATQALMESCGPDADPWQVAILLSLALDVAPVDLLAEAERLAAHPDEARELARELGIPWAS